MREALLLLKAKKSISDSTTVKLRKLFVGIMIFQMIINIVLIITLHDNDYSGIVINFVNILNLSTMYIIAYGYFFRSNSEKVKNDFLKFAIQIPVSKKAVSISKFIHIWIAFIPLFIILIVQNVAYYVKSFEGMSGYIGLCTILACSQFIILSLVGGFSPFMNPRRRFSKAFSFLTVAIVLLSLVIIFATIGLNNEEISYGMFGPRFVGIFERLEFLSGSTGGVVSIVSIVLGYLLSFTIPNKIFGKKGWEV